MRSATAVAGNTVKHGAIGTIRLDSAWQGKATSRYSPVTQ
jgi:hypothetical protein